MVANEGKRDIRVLVIEGSTKAGGHLRKDLGELGYMVDWSQHDAGGFYPVLRNRHDLVVPDMMLLSLDGWQTIEILRKRHDVPVFFLTARDQLRDRVCGLELGAGDYLMKPPSFTKSLLRIHTLLRRGVTREAK